MWIFTIRRHDPDCELYFAFPLGFILTLGVPLHFKALRTPIFPLSIASAFFL